MSPPTSLRKHTPYLTILKHSDKIRRKNILKNSSKEQLNTLCNICYNIANGGLPLTSKLKSHLKRHKRVIRLLAQKSLPLSKKRQLMISQTGGFWPMLLASVIPSAISAIKSLT